MGTYLDRILTHHRERAAADPRVTEQLIEACSGLPPTRPLADALRGGATLAVICEVKRRSPSKGGLNPDLDPARTALAYQRGGAAAISVLTDAEHFGGSAGDLRVARAAVEVPVLRKDFTVCENDLCDARLMGADAVLLIVAALDDAELERFDALAGRLGLEVLVETHDEHEVHRALRATSGRIIGVNQRDLVTFEVDTARAIRVAACIPDSAVRVAESGVRGPDDARALAGAGYHAVLVGEHLVTAADPEAAVRELAVPRR